MEVRDWSAFACPNPKCSLFGQRGQANLRPHGWSSKERNIRCLRCTRCGKNFSERYGTPFYRTQLPAEQLLAIAQHVVEGDGMRSTSRLCHVTLNTVLRYAHRAGDHAAAFHDQMVQHVQVNQVQADEAWSYVGKKDKNCQPDEPADREQGSYWDHVLLDVESRLIVSLVIGKRTTASLQQAFTDFYQRTDGGLPALITTDEYAAYFSVIVSTWGVRKEDLEMTETQKEEYGWDDLPSVYFPVEIAYATIHKERPQGRVVRVEPRIVFGTAEQITAA